MKHKLFIISILASFRLFSQTPILNQFVEIDSTFIEFENSTSLYFYYKVSKKQTLYSISKIFQCSIDTIKQNNPVLIDNSIREGEIIKIPFNRKIIQFSLNGEHITNLKVYYKVKAGESLYHLSKRVFNINLQQLIQINQLESFAIKQNMDLLIGYITFKQKEAADFALTEVESSPKNILPMDSLHFTKSSKGVAMSQLDKLGSGRLFALHNEAQMDSYIEIENPILNRKIYAKVIGRIPPVYERDIQIIISSEAAKILGAVDKRFFISLRYR